jgi:hypothetical protein
MAAKRGFVVALPAHINWFLIRIIVRWETGRGCDVGPEGSPHGDLLRFAEQRFDGLHDQRLRISTAIRLQLSRIRDEALRLESRITALAVVVAAQPDRDVLRTRNLVSPQLLACDLCYIERHLRPRRRNGSEGEYHSHCNERELDHNFLLAPRH